MIDAGLSSLLLELYACPGDGTRWPGVLDRLRERLRVRCAAVQLLANGDDRARVKWVARDSESQANRGHHDPFISGDQNPRLRYSPTRLPTPTIFRRDRDYLGRDDRDLVRLHERLADLGLGSCLSAGVSVSADETLVLVLHRDVNDCRGYSSSDEALVTTVLPHLRQAISLSGQLESAQHLNGGLRQAVDRMSFGLVLCDAESRLRWANRNARSSLSDRDGLWLKQGRLTTASPTETDALRRAIAHAAGPGGDAVASGRDAVASPGRNAVASTDRCLLLNRAESGSPLQVMIAPVHDELGTHPCSTASTASRRQVLLLFSRASRTPILAPGLVATLFALSPAEARLTVALCQGHTVNDYAAAHGVSVGTARFQLKQVLAKTQAPRQSDLVRRVCTSVAAHAMHAEGRC